MSTGTPQMHSAPIQLGASTSLAPIDKNTLIIAMTPRSGSTNLCSVLSKLKTFGDPQEYFNPRGPMGHFAKAANASSASDYMAAVAAKADVFCFKVAAFDWGPFAARATVVFPKARYVYLDRIDIDAQAISLFRAKASQRWHARAVEKNVRPPPTPQFDAAGIEACRQELFAEKRRWADFFFESDIKPLCISYEQLLSDMPRAVHKICREAGRELALEEVLPGDYRVMRDDITERWKKRLRKMRQNVEMPGEED
jgi:LPS sulfotransferase NodH